jgi:hypothetical protein
MSISRFTKVRSRNFSRSILAETEFDAVIGPPGMHEASNCLVVGAITPHSEGPGKPMAA